MGHIHVVVHIAILLPTRYLWCNRKLDLKLFLEPCIHTFRKMFFFLDEYFQRTIQNHIILNYY